MKEIEEEAEEVYCIVRQRILLRKNMKREKE